MREHFYTYPRVVELPNRRDRSEAAPVAAPRAGAAPVATAHSGAQTHAARSEASS